MIEYITLHDGFDRLLPAIVFDEFVVVFDYSKQQILWFSHDDTPSKFSYPSYPESPPVSNHLESGNPS